MKIFSWFLLIFSAILYAAPLTFPTCAWWISFLFPIPLLYVAFYENMSFTKGFIWGAIANGTILVGVLFGIDKFTTTQNILPRLLPGLGLISWSAINHGVWFWGATQIKKIMRLRSPLAIILLWTLALWWGIFFFDRLCLWPFGRIEGYFGFHPIITLATHPQLLTLLPIIGKNLLSFCLYLVPASITYCLIQKNKQSLLFFGLACIPWIASLMISIPPMQNPPWMKDVIIGQAFFSIPGACIGTQVKTAQKYFKTALHNHPQATIIILPESTFYCTELVENPQFVAQWGEQFLGKPIHIIFGALRYNQGKIHNTMLWVYNGKLISFFDKRHSVALTERVPPCINTQYFHDLFFKDAPEITPSQTQRFSFKVNNELHFTPYICSELYFNEHPDDPFKDMLIVATINDRWCTVGSVEKIIHLGARFRAMQWQRNIIFASYKYASYFDQYGNTLPLNISTKKEKIGS